MALDLSQLTAALEAETNAKTAVLAYVDWVAQQLAALAAQVVTQADKDALLALSAQVKDTADQIATAVVINTPAEPPTP